jgi:hypothetical protein
MKRKLLHFIHASRHYFPNKKTPDVRRGVFLIAALVTCVASILVYTGSNFNQLLYKNNKINLTKEKTELTAESIKNTCAEQNIHQKNNCYTTELQKVVRTYGLATGEATLLILQEKEPFTRSCHVISHNMSNEAYKRNPRDFYTLINSVNVNICSSGFLHGVLEAYTANNPETEADGAFIDDICGRGNNPYRNRTCIHFIGHVLLVNAFGNLSEALEGCRSVRPEWQFNCYDGIFMEDHQKVILSQHNMFPLPTLDEAYFNKIEGVCLTKTGIIGKACWTEMAEMYAHAYGYIPDIIFKNCSKAQTDEFDRDCYSKGVIAMAIYPGFDTTEKLKSLCSFYKEATVYDSCTQTLLSSLIYNSPKFTTRGVTLCSSFTSTYTEQCFKYLGTRLHSVIPERDLRSPYCALIPDMYRSHCLQ